MNEETELNLTRRALLMLFSLLALTIVAQAAKINTFDLATLREDTWQGRPVYVVGAKAGDMHSPQFWIDKQRLYFVRMFRPAGKDGVLTSETQFNKYEQQWRP